jgi:hypothetical protein
MHNAHRSILVLVCSLALFACDKDGRGSRDPARSGEAAGAASTPAQQRLAHYTTTDGMIGFTLDRTGAVIKFRVDGDKDIVQLTQQEERDHRGDLVGYRLVDPANAVRVFIAKDGSVIFVRGHDELAATPDRTPEPLGAPTIAGPPVAQPEAPAASAELAADLAAISVRKKFSEFDAKDSADLAKVAAAIAKADAAMFVHYVDPGPDGWKGQSETVPSAFSGFSYGGGDFSTDEDEAKRYKKVAKHGARIFGVSSPDRDMGNHILVRPIEGAHAPVDKAPGLVWEVQESKVVFVTLDGARFVLDLNQKKPPLARGAGPKSAWPSPLSSTFADVEVVSGLVKAGVVPKSTLAQLEEIDAGWNACVAKRWKPKRIARDVNWPAEAVAVHRSCRAWMTKLDVALGKFMEDRAAARKSLYEKAITRVEKVGAAK